MSQVIKNAEMAAITSGSYTTVAASDTVATGLREVVMAVVTLSSDPVIGCDRATVVIPNQISSGGNITVKTWKPTTTTDATPIAATTFSKVVNWIAWGK